MSINVFVLLVGLLLLCSVVNATGIDVRQYGAKGDGVVDDSVAIQKALDAAKDKGGVVELGVGTFRLDNPISYACGSLGSAAPGNAYKRHCNQYICREGR